MRMNGDLIKKILDVVPVEHGKSAPEYRATVNKILEDFGVKRKCFLHTTDNEPTMACAFPSNIRNGCMAHMESNASKFALKEVKVVKEARSHVREIAGKFNKSNKFKKALIRNQKKADIPVLSIHQEVKTRFTSTFDMFGSVLQARKGEIDEDRAWQNVNAINQALKETMKVDKYNKAKIKKETVDIMLDLYPLLYAMEEGITLMGGEKYGTGSSVLPFLFMFNKVLKEDSTDRKYVTDVKKKIKEYLAKATKKNLNFLILSCATFLDKRYSSMSFLDDKKKAEVKKKILEELHELEANASEEAVELKTPPPKKKRLLSFDIDGDLDEIVEGEGQAERELKSFELEAKLTIGENPLEWWKGRRQKYPLMFQLARKYFCVMGTLTPAERVFSKMGRVLTKSRMSMKGDLFSSLMFLSDCNI